ncbi:MAG TPA: cation-transporting P-type ATPase, partial [Candidatus Saccharimonadia bacterium]|nr:cation-transporting P-type ATPase [Candidatus Saccharimonadia bacterium]
MNIPRADAAETDASTWMEGLAAFLQQEEAVMAVRVNPEDKTISVATRGEMSSSRLKEKLEKVIRELDATFVTTSPVNHGVDHAPGGNASHDGILLKKASQGGEEWRWRKFPWPTAVEPDDEREWKRMAVEAFTCGVFLVVGFVLDKSGHAGWPMVTCYVVSMIAGGATAAMEAWHKIQQRRLDIHFLMIAVAVAASSIGAWREGALLLFLFSTSGSVEHYVLHRTRREI